MDSKRAKTYLIAFIAIINLLVLFHFQVSAADLIKYLLTLILATLVPGLLILNLLKLYPYTLYRFILAFALGIAADILLFMAFSSINLRHLIFVVLGIMILIYLKQGYCKNDIALLRDRAGNISLTAFILPALLSLTALVLIVWFYFLPNHLPGLEAVVYHVDYPWHLGNIAEILHHWYPQDPRIAGQQLNYHIFFYIYTAFIAYCSKLGLPLLFFRLNIIIFIYLLMGGAYFLASRWYQSRGAGFIHVAITLLLGTALIAWPHNVFLRNFFISPTFLLGLILLMPLLSEIDQYIKKPDPRNLTVILLLVFAVSGAKGSFFPVVGAALIGMTAYALIKKTKAIPVLLLTAGSLAVFITVFLLIFKGPGGEGINFMPLEIIMATGLYQHLSSLFSQPWQLWLLIIPLYIIGFFSFRLLALIHVLVLAAKKPFEIRLRQIFLGGMILAGVVPAYLLTYRGTSQYYFLLVSWAVLNLISSGYIIKTFTKQGKILIKTILVFLMLLSFADTIATMQFQDYSCRKHMALNNKPMTPAVYQGMEYLRAESPPDAVIASFRSFWLNKENPRFFYYSAFSERRMVVEGWMYMRPEYQEMALLRYNDMQELFYTRNEETAMEILEKYNIDYILVDKGHNQRLRFAWSEILDKVFSNTEVDIYRYPVSE